MFSQGAISGSYQKEKAYSGRRQLPQDDIARYGGDPNVGRGSLAPGIAGALAAPIQRTLTSPMQSASGNRAAPRQMPFVSQPARPTGYGRTVTQTPVAGNVGHIQNLSRTQPQGRPEPQLTRPAGTAGPSNRWGTGLKPDDRSPIRFNGNPNPYYNAAKWGPQQQEPAMTTAEWRSQNPPSPGLFGGPMGGSPNITHTTDMGMGGQPVMEPQMGGQPYGSVPNIGSLYGQQYNQPQPYGQMGSVPGIGGLFTQQPMGYGSNAMFNPYMGGRSYVNPSNPLLSMLYGGYR